MADERNPADEASAHHEPVEARPEESGEPRAADETASDADTRIAELNDQVLRARAEAENVRRRAANDVERAHKFALEKFVAELLPVVDSLEKAVETARQVSGADVNAIGEGVGLSLKLFLDVLSKCGVDQVDPAGEPFNPELHEAMTLVAHPDMEPNSVVDVMQKGYTLNGRLVRPAMVVVSKPPAGPSIEEQV